jgi:hypothetical protein
MPASRGNSRILQRSVTCLQLLDTGGLDGTGLTIRAALCICNLGSILDTLLERQDNRGRHIKNGAILCRATFSVFGAAAQEDVIHLVTKRELEFTSIARR